MAVHALVILGDSGQHAVAGFHRIVAHRFRLRRAHHVDVGSILRAQRQFALESRIERDLHFTDFLRLVPRQFQPGRLAFRQWCGPVMYFCRVSVFIRGIPQVAIAHQFHLGRPYLA